MKVPSMYRVEYIVLFLEETSLMFKVKHSKVSYLNNTLNNISD